MNWNGLKFRVLLLTGVLILPFIGWWEGSLSAASVSGAPFVLTFQNNLLSAKIETVSLREVTERLAQLTKIEISLDRSIGNETVTAEFENLPLKEGIQRILQGKSYALIYAPAPLGSLPAPKVAGIRVLSKGAGPSMDKESADSVTPFSGSDTREGPPESATASGLRDQDRKVRENALERLGQSGQPVPVESLAEMALTDTSPQLRMDALALLVEKGGDAALDSLNQAVRDQDPGVSLLAKGLLEERTEAMAEAIRERNEGGGEKP
jgi:hypothetical protein